ncbi:MAG: hypothetical protein EXQ81_10435 [Thermoleophilia bacterium]|nr:hypothetical protein [Thermoleophilia bacterium]
MYVLGISCFYHDAAAAILKDGIIVAAAEEERFSRRKHDSGFPVQAIAYCLRAAGIDAGALDAVAFYEKPLLKFERILASVVDTFPRSLGLFQAAMPPWLRERLFISNSIRAGLAGYRGPLYFSEHHLSHAASAFLLSPFEEAAILTTDGVGEWASTTYGVGRGSSLELTHEIRFPHSLGLFYSAFTAHLGFEVNEGEYKVMGLAAYGKPSQVDLVRRLIDVKLDGSFRLDMSYFAYHRRLETMSPKFRELFGPAREPDAPMDERYADIAASVQQVVEETLLAAVAHLHRETGLSRLVMAGGVALNGVANGRILRESQMRELWVQPAAGDSGGALGAAVFVHTTLLGAPRPVMEHAYLGPEFSGDEIRAFLDGHGLPYRTLTDEELIAEVAALLAQGKVIGWFRGRMEFGPRALGSRSILASPLDIAMQDIVNTKIKHREQFRPFAPSVLAEAASEYFELDGESPYMLIVAPVRPEMRSVIPAVTHVDGTARIQTVTLAQNPGYHALISAFGALTGVPVLLNTSFNIRGEPIVNTPAEAYNCFAYTDMDHLVLGNHLVGAESKVRLAAYPGRARVDMPQGVL